MRTHFEQVPLESVKRVLGYGESQNIIQMPAPVSGVALANNPDGYSDAAKAIPQRETRPERWRELAEAASREQNTGTLLKLVEDLVRELPGPDLVKSKDGHLETK